MRRLLPLAAIVSATALLTACADQRSPGGGSLFGPTGDVAVVDVDMALPADAPPPPRTARAEVRLVGLDAGSGPGVRLVASEVRDAQSGTLPAVRLQWRPSVLDQNRSYAVGGRVTGRGGTLYQSEPSAPLDAGARRQAVTLMMTPVPGAAEREAESGYSTDEIPKVTRDEDLPPRPVHNLRTVYDEQDTFSDYDFGESDGSAGSRVLAPEKPPAE